MLLFLNAKSHNYFAVHNQLCKVEYLPTAAVRAFRKFSDYFDEIEELTLPDLDTIEKFRKLVKAGALKDVPLRDTKAYLLAHFPEYFI